MKAELPHLCITVESNPGHSVWAVLFLLHFKMLPSIFYISSIFYGWKETFHQKKDRISSPLTLTHLSLHLLSTNRVLRAAKNSTWAALVTSGN